MPLVHFLANLDMIWLDHSREHVLLLQGGAENFLSVKVTAQLISFSKSPDVFTRTDNPFYYTTIWYTVLICRVKSLSVVPVYKSHASLSI